MRSALLVVLALGAPAQAQLPTAQPPVIKPPAATTAEKPSAEAPKSTSWDNKSADCPKAMPTRYAPLILPKGCPAPDDGVLLPGSLEAFKNRVVEKAPSSSQWLVGGLLGAAVIYASCDKHLGEAEGGGCSDEVRWSAAGVAVLSGAIFAYFGD
ncbi:MAG: hypothetical protein GY871_04485 [Actinomycetales bacterium]|nr:hypothetical protein [Actinomycetales bacterium]